MAETPHYHGHRARLRQRLMDGGPEALPDYEILELLLFNAIPRKDVKPIAKALLDAFGSLGGVLAAPPRELARVDGIGAPAAAALKAVHAASLRMMQAQVKGRTVVESWQALVDYCQASMAHEAREQFRVLFLDRRNRLIHDEVQQTGTVDQTAVYPREVVKRALELGASALIMVHNHPSGDPTPSRADVEMTRQVIRAADPLGIAVHDHVVIGHGRHASLRALGLI